MNYIVSFSLCLSMCDLLIDASFIYQPSKKEPYFHSDWTSFFLFLRLKIATSRKIRLFLIGLSLIYQNEGLGLLKRSSFVFCFELHQSELQLKIDGEIHICLFHDGSSYYIETRLSSWNSFQTSVPFLPFSESMLSPEAFWYSQMGQEQNYLYIVSD